MAQDRKVFVGGVPQDLNQDDLYAIFSEYAGVKKAWLQKCRNTEDVAGGTTQCPPQNHRGFGFVIFHDVYAIDELLGGAASRFIVLRNGAKLEVKRALSSNKMGFPSENGVPPLEQGMPQQKQQLLQQHAIHQNQSHMLQAANQIAARELPQAQIYHHPLGAGLARDQLQPAHVHVLERDGWPSVGIPGGCGLAPLSAAMHHGMTGPFVGMQRRPPATPMHAGISQALHRTTVPAVSPPQSSNSLREAIMRFYHERCPEKLTERDFVDFICSVYEGREAELDENLRRKYGTGLEFRSQQGSVLAGTMPLAPKSDMASATSPATTAAMMAAVAAAAKPTPQSQLETRGLLGAGGLCPAAPGLTDVGTYLGGADGAQSWPPAAPQRLAQITTKPARGLGGLEPWIDPAQPIYTQSDNEGPDISWIDQIVGDDMYDMSENIGSQIMSKTANLQRRDALQQNVIW